MSALEPDENSGENYQPSGASIVRTTPDERWVRYDQGDQTDWLKATPAQRKNYEMTLTVKVLQILGTLIIDVYGEDPFGEAIERQEVSAVATYQYRTTALTTHYLKLSAKAAGHHAQYEFSYTLTPVIATAVMSTPTTIPTATPTATLTPIPPPTAEPTFTPTATATVTAAPTLTPTSTVMPAATATTVPTIPATPTATITPIVTPVPTVAPTTLATAIATPIIQPIPTTTPSVMDVPVATFTPTVIPTIPLMPTVAPTSTIPPVLSPTATPSEAIVPLSMFTTMPSSIPTPTPSASPSPVPDAISIQSVPPVTPTPVVLDQAGMAWTGLYWGLLAGLFGCLVLIAILVVILLRIRKRLAETENVMDVIMATEYKLLGEWATAKGNLPLARKCYRKAAEQEAKTSATPYKIGLAYFEAEQYEQAIDELNKCLTDDVLRPRVYFYLAYAYLNLKDYANAEEYFKALVQLKSKDPYVYVGLGVIYQARGQVEQAKYAYTKALECDPNCQEARENLSQFR